MKKDPQAADDQVEQVVQELHICNHSFVTTSEGSTVPDKAHEEDDLITELKNNEKQKNDTQNQPSHSVKGAKCLSRKQVLTREQALVQVSAGAQVQAEIVKPLRDDTYVERSQQE